MKIYGCGAVAALGLAVGICGDEVEFSQVPGSVQKTINRNLNGGIVKEIDRDVENGRTIYEVEIRREGKQRRLQVDAAGNLLAKTEPGDTLEGEKHDGKLFGVIDNAKDTDTRAEAQVDRDGLQVETDLEKSEDGEIAEDIFDKNDGKILGIPILGRDQSSVRVEADAGGNQITTDADGGLDTDKDDGRILGLPKRGFETLPLARVPEPVRATISREAAGRKVAEIELATLDGEIVYEVDIERDGWNRELHISADGRILKDSDANAVGAPAAGVRGTRSSYEKPEVKIETKTDSDPIE